MEENTTPAMTTKTVGIRYGMIYGVISIVYFLIFVLAELDSLRV